MPDRRRSLDLDLVDVVNASDPHFRPGVAAWKANKGFERVLLATHARSGLQLISEHGSWWIVAQIRVQWGTCPHKVVACAHAESSECPDGYQVCHTVSFEQASTHDFTRLKEYEPPELLVYENLDMYYPY